MELADGDPLLVQVVLTEEGALFREKDQTRRPACPLHKRKRKRKRTEGPLEGSIVVKIEQMRGSVVEREKQRSVLRKHVVPGVVPAAIGLGEKKPVADSEHGLIRDRLPLEEDVPRRHVEDVPAAREHNTVVGQSPFEAVGKDADDARPRVQQPHIGLSGGGEEGALSEEFECGGRETCFPVKFPIKGQVVHEEAVVARPDGEDIARTAYEDGSIVGRGERKRAQQIAGHEGRTVPEEDSGNEKYRKERPNH